MEWNARDKASGVFFFRLQQGEVADVKPMILLKLIILIKSGELQSKLIDTAVESEVLTWQRCVGGVAAP
ncbi:MAG: hypothetical protein HKN37_17505 [Rhodothermales bacterium]|nr:hypothetical protein [Rhodothermales bacterium]